MSKQGLKIDYDYYVGNPNYFEDIEVAASKLTVASQEEFEEIKNEKWFNRVFDLVTFSKKNEKRVASQIGSLAQAQEIVVEILVRLSARDQKISDLVLKSFSDIEKLSQQDITIAKKIKQLENSFVFGISMETNLEEFSQLEKQILGGTLHSLMKTLESVSDNQRKYANAILNFIEVEAQQIDINKSINALDSIDTKRKILNCSMEYIFLNDLTFEYSDEIGIIFDEFDFGNKTIEQIKDKIKSIYDLRGVNGFIDKYNAEEYLELEGEFFVELVGLEEVEEITDTMISSILKIDQGKTKIIKNSTVRINSFINCMGELIFDNCTLYYNIPDYTNGITLKQGATLQILNSKIICMDINENIFIKGEGDNRVILKECNFNDCSYFLDLNNGSKSELVIDSCNIINPGTNFFNTYVEKGLMTNCNIKVSMNTSDSFYESIFVNFGYNEEEFIVNECVVYGDALPTDRMDDNIFGDIFPTAKKVFSIDMGFYKNCSFINVSNCITHAREISESEFLSCKNVIYLVDIHNEICNITSCIFKECVNVIQARKAYISNCQFEKCRGRIMGISESFTVEFCEFYNIVNSAEHMLDSSLEFSRGKKSSSSTLKKCIFDGVDLKNAFLISGNVYEKLSGPVAYIEDSTFRNCKTNRKSGKIIKEYGNYYGLFNKRIEVKAISISNCIGLDKINKENGFTDDVIIKGKTSKGIRIGATIIAAGLGGVSSAIIANTIVDKLIKDTDMHAE